MRPLLSIIVAAAVIAIAGHSAAAQGFSGTYTKLDTGRITLLLDGREQTATAVAYVVAGELFINGMWLQDSSARYGTASIASAYTLRVRNRVGEHSIASESSGVTFFSTLFSRPDSGRAYTIFRSDEKGGNGSVTIASITAQSVRGTFTFVAYNSDNPSETKTISGKFDVAYSTLVE